MHDLFPAFNFLPELLLTDRNFSRLLEQCECLKNESVEESVDEAVDEVVEKN